MPIRSNLAEKNTIVQRHKLKLNKSYFNENNLNFFAKNNADKLL